MEQEEKRKTLSKEIEKAYSEGDNQKAERLQDENVEVLELWT